MLDRTKPQQSKGPKHPQLYFLLILAATWAVLTAIDQGWFSSERLTSGTPVPMKGLAVLAPGVFYFLVLGALNKSAKMSRRQKDVGFAIVVISVALFIWVNAP